MLLRFLNREQQSRESTGKWFCSELVLAAFQKVANYMSHQNVAVVNAISEYNKAMQDAAIKAGERVLSTAAGISR